MSGSRRLAAFNTSPTDCGNGTGWLHSVRSPWQWGSLSQGFIGSAWFPGRVQLHLDYPGQTMATVLPGMEILTPGLCTFSGSLPCLLNCPLLRDWIPL